MPKAMNLKYFRRGRKLSQQKLADELNVTRSTIIAWEKHVHSIPKGASERIAEYFGISYYDFCNVDFEKKDREMMSDGELTHSEIQSVYKFRRLKETTKEIIRATIDAAYRIECEEADS